MHILRKCTPLSVWCVCVCIVWATGSAYVCVLTANIPDGELVFEMSNTQQLVIGFVRLSLHTIVVRLLIAHFRHCTFWLAAFA